MKIEDFQPSIEIEIPGGPIKQWLNLDEVGIIMHLNVIFIYYTPNINMYLIIKYLTL